MIPTTRQEFSDYCLRKVGAPVIDIEIDELQIDDRIDEALKYYQDFHYNGSEHTYYKHIMTDTDIQNSYIDIGDPLMFSITRMFNIGALSLYSTNMFSINYQIALNDLYTLTSVSMVPYYLAMEQLQLIKELLVGRQPIRFNQLTNRIYIDMTPGKVAAGQYLIFEGYRILDPNTYATIWGDRWLQNYATCLIKLQWLENISKYKDVEIISGSRLNVDRMLDDTIQLKEKLESEMIYSWSLPPLDFYG